MKFLSLATTSPMILNRRAETAAGLLFLAIFGATYFGVQLYSAPAVISPVAGIALAGLFIAGLSFWPVILAASFLAYLLGTMNVETSIVLSIGYTIQALAGVFLLKKMRFDPSFTRLRDMFVFMITAFISSIIVPTLGTLVAYVQDIILNQPHVLSFTWGSWWTGVLTSTLIVTPFVLSWLQRPRYKYSFSHKIELILVFMALFIINYFLFWTTFVRIGSISLIYFLLVPLMWTGLRFNTRFMTLAILCTTLAAFLGMYFGSVPIDPARTGLQIFQTEVFANIIASLFFIVAAAEEERKTALEKIQLHISQLEEAVGIRDEFISVASHELKTPVTTLKIYSQVMQKKLEQKGEHTLTEQAAKMDKQLNKLISLVEDLLNASRVQMGKLEFNKETFDLNQLTKETVEDIQPSAPNHRIEINGRTPKEIWGDKYRIAQVLINLINNGIKYSPHADRIVVVLSDEGGMAKVSVSDFGIGIDERHHQKIFDLFYRVSDVEISGRTFPGFGIGLHISHEIIKRHNGELSVQSAKGRGSTFSFSLPYVRN